MSPRSTGVLAVVFCSWLAGACSNSGPPVPLATGAAGQGAAGAASTGVAGSTPGAAGSTTAGAAGASAAAGAVGDAAGAAGVTGAAGTGVGGALGAAGAMTPGLTDPGTDGDGDFMVASPHPADALNGEMGAPKGHIITYVMKSSDSMIYPGRKGPYSRSVWVYVPTQYVPGTPAPFMVVQDGSYAVWFGTNAPHTPDSGTGALLNGTANVARILDNLIMMGKLPNLVVLFVDNGGGDAEGSERGLEYDSTSGLFAQFVDQEVLPRAITEVKTQLSIDLAFTQDPQGRATMGGSSGGAASFSMPWFHPELFGRAITFSGTFVRQASPEDPMYPHGCWAYHDFDPYDATAPNGAIVKEPTTKPLRMWLEVAQNDMGAGSGPTSYRDFKLANERMAASFKLKGYHYHFDYALGAGHFDGGVVSQTLPGALEWLWRGYPVN
jgi:iron(III)-enterobactin esterase